MAESTDKTTRRIAEKRVEKGKEFEGYQEAQNQLLSIQAEQQQNLALQSQAAANIQAQNQMLGQAAEIMNMDNLNPTTQGMLSRYGLSQPRVIRNTQTQRQGPNNITINNTTINNASGPVQGREISIKPQEASQGRFKAWLTNVFARQDAQWQKQNQEYARRESGLTRNANKMMRKIESLGKEIGNAVDPRKASQRAQNSTMNLLKALGFVYFAKKLPKIFEFINKAEVWVKDLGEKIGGFFGEATNIDLDDPSTIWGKIKYTFWNKKETGIFNVLLEKISRAIYDRKQLADAVIGEVDWKVLQPGESMKHFLDWFTTFMGGTKAARTVLNEKRERNIQEDMHLSENYSGTEKDAFWDGWVNNIRLTDSNNSAILVKKAGGGTDIQNEFDQWAKDKGYNTFQKNQHKEDFLKERGKDLLAYFGEADILTARLHQLKQLRSGVLHKGPGPDVWGGSNVLTKLDFNRAGTRLNNSSYRSTLAASLEIFKLLKEGSYSLYGGNNTSINTERVLYLLKLLAKSDDILVFEKFTTMFKVPFDDIEDITIKLVIHSMAGSREREFYQNGHDFSTYYRKILYETDEGDKVKLTEEPDFNNRKDQDHWKVVKIDVSVIQDIIYKLLGTNTIEDYSSDTQQLLANNLKNQGIITETQLKNTQQNISVVQSTDRVKMKYDESISNINDIEREAKEWEQAHGSPSYSENAVGRFSGGDYQTLGKNGLVVKNITEEERKNNARKIFDLLKQDGFTDEQAAGILGVIQQESNFNPAAINVQEYKEGKMFGEGLAQWSNSRKKDFENWWKQKHPNEAFPGIHNVSLEDQVEFLLKEFKERKVYNKIKSLANGPLSPQEILEQTTDLFTRGFENGGKGGLASERFMDETYSKYYKHYKGYKDSILRPRLENASGIYNTFVKQGSNNVSTGKKVPTERSAKAILKSGEHYSVQASATPTYQPGGSNPMTETGALEFASNMTPANSTKAQEENSSNNLLAQCANGINYIATSIAPLNDNINTGNMRVAEAIMKSKAPQNLTPQEPPLNTNRT